MDDLERNRRAHIATLTDVELASAADEGNCVTPLDYEIARYAQDEMVARVGAHDAA